MATRHEAARDIEVMGEWDVIVVGGGPAGVGAALAAGRAGKKTLVVEQFNCLGGVATAGGHGHISNYEAWHTQTRIAGGIADEIADRVVEMGIGTRCAHAIDFEVEGLKLLLERMAREAGVDLLYHTFFCETLVEDGQAVGVVVQNKNGRRAAMGKRVIDCTGDGDAGATAGCPVEIGRPGDQKCQPVTLMFTIGGVDWDRVTAFKEEYRKKYPDGNNWKLDKVYEEAVANGDMRPYQTGNMGWWWTSTRPDWVGVNFTHVIHIDTTKAEDLTRATLEAREQAYETIDVYRKYIGGMENCYMISTPNTIGLRESRRLMGDYVLTEEDLHNQAEFDDAIGYGSFFVDVHNIDGPGMSGTCWHPPKGFKYQIPYRILVPSGVENLLAAGRCVSCTHIALGSLRVMVPCIIMGETAGAAAALSLETDTTPRAVDTAELRRRLRDAGAILDENDIAHANAGEAVTA